MVEFIENDVLDYDLESWLQLLVELSGQHDHGVPLELILVVGRDAFDDLKLNEVILSRFQELYHEHIKLLLKFGLQINCLDLGQNLLKRSYHVAVKDDTDHEDQLCKEHGSGSISHWPDVTISDRGEGKNCQVESRDVDAEEVMVLIYLLFCLLYPAGLIMTCMSAN